MRRSGRIILAVVLAAGAIGALVTGERVYSRLLAAGLVLLTVTWLWAASALWGLRLSRTARSVKASVGDLLDENYEIANATRLPRLWVEVVNSAGIPGSAGSRLFTFIRGHQRRFYLSRTWLTKRGAFALGPTTLTAGDPFGLFSTHRVIPFTQTLIVLPMLVDVPSFPLPAGALPGGQSIRRKASGVTPYAAGVREYVTGDPMRAIHWQSTARRDRLMVKEFEQDPQAETWIFLDAAAAVNKALSEQDEEPQRFDELIFRRRRHVKLAPATIEYGVTLAASLAHYFIEHGRAVGLVAAAQALTVIPAERGERQESKILETLAFINADGDLSIAALAGAQARHLPLGSSVILITPSPAPEVALAADEFQRRNQRLIVLLMDARTFGGDEQSEAVLGLLAARAVPVCQIRCGDDLPENLAVFSRQVGGEARWMQRERTRPWAA
jgi:uncharacterized protein (DUF58 family)